MFEQTVGKEQVERYRLRRPAGGRARTVLELRSDTNSCWCSTSATDHGSHFNGIPPRSGRETRDS